MYPHMYPKEILGDNLSTYLLYCQSVLGHDEAQPTNIVSSWITRHTLGRTQEKPASAFVRHAISSKKVVKPVHAHLKNQVLQKSLSHREIIERDSIPTPLSKLEQNRVVDLMNRIYGGVVTQSPYIETYADLDTFVRSVYNSPNLQTVRIGTLISFLSNHCRPLMDIARLSHNTLRRLIRRAAPPEATRRGRGCRRDLENLAIFLNQKMGLVALGI